jgi:hypothetical protein
MARWQVQLSGEPIDLEELPRLFDQAPARVREDQGGYVLESEAFESLPTATEVRERAAAILPMINGAARLHYSGFHPAALGAVFECTATGRSVSVFPGSAEIRIKASAVLVKTAGTAPLPPPPATSNKWLARALTDEPIRHVLTLLGKQPCSWHDLYKLMEVLQANGGDELLDATGISRNQLNRFTQTANSVHAIGDDARHAQDSIPAPKKPMSLSDARQLIYRWARAWLTSRSA